MRVIRLRPAPALLAIAVIFLSACGSDSTGPTSLDSHSALRSLALGLNQIGDGQSPTTVDASAVLNAIEPLLDKVTVTIDGSAQNMYALGLRESFPPGTCEETLFVDPLFPPDGSVCTPPSLGVVILLWQSHSANELPDKLVLLAADVGTSTFDFMSQSFPAVALYVEGQDKIFGSESGTLTSQVAATNQSCDVPFPPYAKSATCSFATFTEQGSIVLSEFTLDGPSSGTITLGIPSITLDGLWLNITEVQPIPLTATRNPSSRSLPLLFTPAR